MYEGLYEQKGCIYGIGDKGIL